VARIERKKSATGELEKKRILRSLGKGKHSYTKEKTHVTLKGTMAKIPDLRKGPRCVETIES